MTALDMGAVIARTYHPQALLQIMDNPNAGTLVPAVDERGFVLLNPLHPEN